MHFESGYVNWINRGGYRVANTEKYGDLVCEINPVERFQENVLKNRPALHREFAALKPSVNSVLAFASRYGLLEGRYKGVGYLEGRKHISCKTDELKFWYEEIATFKEAVQLFDLAYGEYGQVSPNALSKRFKHLGSGPTTTGLEQLSQKVVKLDSMWLRERRQTADGRQMLTPVSTAGEGENFIGAARASLADLVNARLRSRVAPELVYRHNEDGALVSTPLALVTTGGLIGALWFQFAKAIDEGKFFSQCSVCGNWFEGRAEASGLKGVRKGRQYCSDACRQKAYRDRKRDAESG